MDKISTFMMGTALGLSIAAVVLGFIPDPKPIIKYIYDRA